MHDCTARNYITKSVFDVVYEYTYSAYRAGLRGTYSTVHSPERVGPFRLSQVLPRLQLTVFSCSPFLTSLFNYSITLFKFKSRVPLADGTRR